MTARCTVRDAVLAELANGPRRANELAKKLSLNINSLYVLLPGYAKQGLIEKADDSGKWDRTWQLPGWRAPAPTEPAVTYQDSPAEPVPLDLATARALLEDAGYQVSLLPRKPVVAL